MKRLGLKFDLKSILSNKVVYFSSVGGGGGGLEPCEFPNFDEDLFFKITCFWAEKSVSISVKSFFFCLEITCFWAEKPFLNIRFRPKNPFQFWITV